MLIGCACLLVFMIMALLMYGRKVSALLALPVMAVVISIIARIPGRDILSEVLAGGALKLSNTYTTTMFGAMLAELLNELGIAKSLIRWVAEFAGEDPYCLGLTMTILTAILFSTLGGLGAVIMVGTIVLPVMLSIGIPKSTAGGLYLFGISLGGMFNIASWQLYMDVLGIPREQVIAFVVPFALLITTVVIFFLAIELPSRKNFLLAALFTLILSGFFMPLKSNLCITSHMTRSTLNYHSLVVVSVSLLLLVIYAFYRHLKQKQGYPNFVLITPLIPLVLVLFFHWEFIPAFLIGLTFASLATWNNNSLNTINRSIIQGITAVIPAVVLMMGIGMLITAVKHPFVAASLAPILKVVIPTLSWKYIVVFTLIAPLSLYRGPLSLWGMGSGLVALIQKATTLSARAIMGMLLSVGQIQGVCDPTNTHNIWIATYLGTDTQTLLRKTLPFAWLAVILGLALAVGSGYVS